MRLPESPASARLAVPIIDARLSSEYSDAYSASQCIDRRVGGGLCVSKLEARAWLSVRVPPSTPVCLVRVATTGSKSQQASLARGFRLSVGNNTYGDEAGNCTDGDVRVQPSGLPGPFDIPCDACPVGEFVTLRHLGPQPDHLALSELAVFTRKGHTPAADESEFRRTCNADPAARVAAVTARFAAAAAELRRAADNCTEHFRHLAEHSARAWLSQCIASSTAAASPKTVTMATESETTFGRRGKEKRTECTRFKLSPPSKKGHRSFTLAAASDAGAGWMFCKTAKRHTRYTPKVI